MLQPKKRSASRCVSKAKPTQCCGLSLAGVITRFMKTRTYWRSSYTGRAQRTLRGFSRKRGRRGTEPPNSKHGRRPHERTATNHENEADCHLRAGLYRRTTSRFTDCGSERILRKAVG